MVCNDVKHRSAPAFFRKQFGIALTFRRLHDSYMFIGATNRFAADDRFEDIVMSTKTSSPTDCVGKKTTPKEIKLDALGASQADSPDAGDSANKAPAGAPPATAAAEIVPAPFRLTAEEDRRLRDHMLRLGHDIDPADLIVAPGSTSAAARPSEYAVIRIPHSHPRRDEMKKKLAEMRDEHNTQLFFKVLPQGPRDDNG